MSKGALGFLEKSFLWGITGDGDLSLISDEQIRSELTKYREHHLANAPSATDSLSVTVGARQGTFASDNEIKCSILYFDEVNLPDPLFEISGWQHLRADVRVARNELLTSLSYMRDIAPLARLGRVKFIPSTHAFEAPKQVPILMSEDAFASCVPAQLRDWFTQRARVRKVISDEQGRWLVLPRPPDADTKSIHIDFGQLGTQRAQDHLRIVQMNDDGTATLTLSVPSDLDYWVAQSTNKAAGDFLRDVLQDFAVACSLRSSYMTSCQATASLLEAVSVKQGDQAAEVINLNMPIIRQATFGQLAELIDDEPEAFKAFRFELKVVGESLAAIEDAAERRAEAVKAADRLMREQVNDVTRKLHEAKQKRKWNIPTVTAGLAAGAFPVLAGGSTLTNILAALGTGVAFALPILREHRDYRAQPGYFLWKLRGVRGS